MSSRTSFEPLDQMIAVIRTVAEFQNSVQNTVRQCLEESRDTLVAFHQQLAAVMAESERYWNEEEAEAFAILARGGWVGMERHFSCSQMRTAVHLYKTKGEAAMNGAILTYFNGRDYALLANMTEEWVVGLREDKDARTVTKEA